ncbi:MAG: DUF5134 domain-containing protein [Actinomycetia bacterium]|nr:DUF5134 domain-containing protein [Actinomycetes bacterium]
MIHDLVLRWVVTALCVLSAVEFVKAIVAGRRSCTYSVDHSLHFSMAVAMAIMAWPRGAELPTTAPMVFFFVAAVWFLSIATVESGHNITNAYHGSMMLSMAWMYAVMSGRLVPEPGENTHESLHQMSRHVNMSGILGPGYTPLIIGLNWLCAVGFTIAAAWWLYWSFRSRREEPTAPGHRFFGAIAQAMLAAAMAVMFGVMLYPG